MNERPYYERELLPSQQKLKDLTDEILAFRPKGYTLNVVSVASELDPAEARMRLKHSAIGSVILLSDGVSLSGEVLSEYSELGQFVDGAELNSVWVQAWESTFESDYPDKIADPNGMEWMRTLDIVLGYGEGINDIRETITLETASTDAGVPPRGYRKMWAAVNLETGYEGELLRVRPCQNDDEAMELISIAQQIFENRPK